MFNHVYAQHWLELSKETRNHLRKVFDIPLTGITEVRDQTIISDGTTNTDLQSISEEKMEKYVGSKENFPRLWELTLAKVKYELNPPINLMDISEINKDNNEEETNGKNKEETTKTEEVTKGESIKRPTFRAAKVSTESTAS